MRQHSITIAVITLAVLACAHTVTAATASNNVDIKLPSVVPYVNVTAFLGTWYEVYDDLSVSIFQREAYCSQAHYGLNTTDGTITVFNRERYGAVDGPEVNISGRALPSPTGDGKLTVELNGVPYPAPYYIYNLGPINAQGLYDYAIISDNVLATLFVLCRDPVIFEAQYDAKVLAQLQSLGFTAFYNKPEVTIQTGCKPFPNPFPNN